MTLKLGMFTMPFHHSMELVARDVMPAFSRHAGS